MLDSGNRQAIKENKLEFAAVSDRFDLELLIEFFFKLERDVFNWLEYVAKVKFGVHVV